MTLSGTRPSLAKNTTSTSVPECLRSRLRLFLSIDLVGSTALKQERIVRTPTSGRTPESCSERTQFERATQWRVAMLEFYQRFQHCFAKEWVRIRKILENLIKYSTIEPPKIEPPKLWKAAGDELIYSQLIVHSYQACLAVRAWMCAAQSFRVEFRKEFPSLDVKMMAWVAGFPVINAEVVFETDPDRALQESENIPNMLVLLLRKLEKYYNGNDPHLILLDLLWILVFGCVVYLHKGKCQFPLN